MPNAALALTPPRATSKTLEHTALKLRKSSRQRFYPPPPQSRRPGRRVPGSVLAADPEIMHTLI
jgi:hypothetical protein